MEHSNEYKIAMSICDAQSAILKKSFVGEDENKKTVLLVDMKYVYDVLGDVLGYIINDVMDDITEVRK